MPRFVRPLFIALVLSLKCICSLGLKNRLLVSPDVAHRPRRSGGSCYTAAPFLIADTIAISRALRMDSRNRTYHHMRMGVQPRVRKCRHAGIWTASNKLEHGDYRTCHFRHLAIATWATNLGARLSATIHTVHLRSIRPSRDSQCILIETRFRNALKNVLNSTMCTAELQGLAQDGERMCGQLVRPGKS